MFVNLYLLITTIINRGYTTTIGNSTSSDSRNFLVILIAVIIKILLSAVMIVRVIIILRAILIRAPLVTYRYSQ